MTGNGKHATIPKDCDDWGMVNMTASFTPIISHISHIYNPEKYIPSQKCRFS